MGDGEKRNAERDARRDAISLDLSPSEWGAWVWHGIRQFEQLLSVDAELKERHGDV